MADAGNDVEQLNAALAAMAEKAAADPEYRESLKQNQVEGLRDAGVSAFTLAGTFEQLGADSEEVAAFGLDLGTGPTTPPPGGETELIWNTNCIRTCRSITLVITTKCTKTWP